MAMQFNLPPAGTTLNAANALENLRLGYMVDRFTGLAIDRDFADQAAAVSAVTGDPNEIQLNISGAVTSVTAAGSYHISDRIIEMTAGGLIAANNGVHISFYNCTFIVTEYTTVNPDGVFAFGITPNTGAQGGPRITSARVTDGIANTRSINFYGCDVIVSTEGQRTLLRCQIADAIGSDFRFIGAGTQVTPNLGLIPSPQRGSRWINSTFVAGQQRSGIAFLETYGFPDVFEGIELYGMGMNNGLEATSAGPRMLIEPNFTLLGQQNIYETQGTARAGFNNQAQILQNIGFFTPPDNDDNADGDVITFRGTGYVNIANGGGGVINYAAYQPTYRDAITSAGIQNVKVRVNSSIVLNNDGTTVASTFHDKLTRPGTTQTIGTSFIGSEYLTNTNGQLASSRFTRDGWSTSEAGYFDPMIFDDRPTVGSDQLAANTLLTPNLTPPANTALAVIQDIRGTSAADLDFTRHEAQYEAFSWSHDILQELSENSTTLFDDSTRATGTRYGINTDLSVTAPNIVGTLVKESVTNSDNTPNLTALQGFFDQDDVPSINDVRMALRYERYQYSQHVRGNPQTNFIHLAVINTNASAWLVATNNTITVRGAGLAAKADDLYTADTNLFSVDMNEHTITGLTLGTRDVGDGSPTQWSDLLHSDTLPAATNSTLIGEYDVVGASGDVINITFSGCNLSGLRLLTPAGVTVNVRGTDNENNPLTANSFANPGAFGLGTVNFPTPTATLTVRPPDEAGVFGVLNVTDNVVVQPAISTGGGADVFYEIPDDNRTDTFRFYWKPTNTAETGYSTTIIERSNATISMSMTEPMTATPLIATLYSGDTSIGTANVEAPVADSRAGRNMGMRILVNNDTTTTGAASQYHILTATNSTRYIDTLMNNNQSADIIVPDSISSSVSNARWVQIDTQTTGEQQQLVGTQFNNLEPGQPEQLQRSILPFVTRLDQLTDRDRFYIRNATDLLQDSERFPGTIGGDQLAGYTLTVVDEDNSSLFSQDIRNILGRFNPNMYSTLFGTVDIRNSSGDVQANYSYTGIELTSTEITFTLTAHNSGTNLPLNDPTVGITSGNTTVSLSGESRTGLQTDQVVQITGTGFSFPSVILFPNPAGATPAQIEQAASNAVNNSTSIAQTRNGVGYLIGTGGDSRLIGIKPRATNYDSTQPYGDNL